MSLLPSDVQRAIFVVDANDAGGLLKKALGLDPRGRKSAFTPRLFLIGCLLTLQENKQLVMADIHPTLTKAVDLDSQVRLGIRDTTGGKPRFSENAIERFSARLSERLEYGRGSAKDLDEDTRALRRDAVMDVVDAMLRATLPDRQSGAFALDGSGIWAWGRAPRRAPKDLLVKDALARRLGVDIESLDLTDPAIADQLQAVRAELKDAEASEDGPEDGTTSAGTPGLTPLLLSPLPYERDAAWGVKTRKDGGRESVFGFDLHALVRAPDIGTKPDSEPKLIQAIDVTPAGQDVVEPSLRLIDRAIASGMAFTELLADRHYSYKAPDRWAKQLTDRNIEQVVDLHKNDQNFRAYNGARLAAGWLHCPATPDHMGKIVHPGPGASDKQKEAFQKQIEERKQYALQRKTVAGARRFTCPALAGTVGCPLREGTVDIAIEGNLPVITNPPARDTAPACCTQTTVELKEDGQRKLWQREYWGSKRWTISNNRRTYVEGMFGNMKNPSTENLSRGTFRITGLARVTLLVGLLAVATNIRLHRNWALDHGDPDDPNPLLAPDSATLPVHMTPEEYAVYQDWLKVRDEPAASLDPAA